MDSSHFSLRKVTPSDENVPETGVVYAHTVFSCRPTRWQCVLSAATTGARAKEALCEFQEVFPVYAEVKATLESVENVPPFPCKQGCSVCGLTKKANPIQMLSFRVLLSARVL